MMEEIPGGNPAEAARIASMEKELAQLRAALRDQKAATAEKVSKLEDTLAATLKAESDAHEGYAARAAGATSKLVSERLAGLAPSQQNGNNTMIAAESKLRKELDDATEELKQTNLTLKVKEDQLANVQVRIATSKQRIDRALDNVNKLKTSMVSKQDEEDTEIRELMKEKERILSVLEESAEAAAHSVKEEIGRVETQLRAEADARVDLYRQKATQNVTQQAHDFAQQAKARAVRLSNDVGAKIVSEYESMVLPMLETQQSTIQGCTTLATKLLSVRDKLISVLASIREGRDTHEDLMHLVKDLPLIGPALPSSEAAPTSPAQQPLLSNRSRSVERPTSSRMQQSLASPSKSNRSRSVERPTKWGVRSSPRSSDGLDTLVKSLQQVSLRMAVPDGDSMLKPPTIIDVDSLAELKDAESLNMSIDKARMELASLVDRVVGRWREEKDGDSDLLQFLRLSQQSLSAMPRPPMISPSAKMTRLTSDARHDMGDSVITDIAAAYRSEIERCNIELSIQQGGERLRELVQQKQAANSEAKQIMLTHAPESEKALEATWKVSLLDPPILEVRAYIVQQINLYVRKFGRAPEIAPAIASVIDSTRTTGMMMAVASEPIAETTPPNDADASEMADLIDHIWRLSSPHFGGRESVAKTAATRKSNVQMYSRSPVTTTINTRPATGITVSKLVGSVSPKL